MPCPGILGSIRLGRLSRLPRLTPPHFVGCWNYLVIPLSQPPKRQLPVTLCARKTRNIGFICALRPCRAKLCLNLFV